VLDAFRRDDDIEEIRFEEIGQVQRVGDNRFAASKLPGLLNQLRSEIAANDLSS
jgi:hypothetical protein